MHNDICCAAYDDDAAEAWGRARISPFPRESDPESLSPFAASAPSREGVGAEGQRACVPRLRVCRQGYWLFAGGQTQLDWLKMGNVWWKLTFACHGERTIAPRGA